MFTFELSKHKRVSKRIKIKLFTNLKYGNVKFYFLGKDYSKKIKNKIKEFCFEERLKRIETFMLAKKSFLFRDYQRIKDKGKEILAYYIEEGYRSDIILGNRLLLINEKVIEYLKKYLGEKRVNSQLEFYKIYLIPEKYAIEKDERIVKMIKSGENIEGLIEDYYIVNVIKNYYTIDRIVKKDFKDIWNDFVILVHDYREAVGTLIVSEYVKNIFDELDLGIYKLTNIDILLNS